MSVVRGAEKGISSITQKIVSFIPLTRILGFIDSIFNALFSLHF